MTARELADTYRRFVKRVDTWANLWDGDLDSLATWEDPTHAGSDVVEREYAEIRDRANVLATSADPADRALLATIAASAELGRVSHQIAYDIQIPSPEVGLLGYLVPFLPRYPLVTADHGDQYLEKLHAFEPFAEAMGVRMAESSRLGMVPLRSHAQRLIEQLGARIQDPSRFLAQPAPTEGYPGWDDRLRDAVEGPLVRGLAAYAAALEEHVIPNGRGDEQAGMVHLGDGAARYDELVKAHTTLDVVADQVHHLGLAEMERLDDEYRAIAGPVLGTDDLAEIFTRLRDDRSLRYERAEDVVDDALAAMHRAAAAAGEWFGRVPVTGCEGVAIDGGALAFYSPPPEGGGDASFFFNTADPAVWTTFGLEAVAYHESIPGHHFQLAAAIEDDTLHWVQQRSVITAYNEGWGLYSERLSDEMGLYTSDLARVGMLVADSLRASRLVVDTGMHALGWSRQQAIDYMVTRTPIDIAEVVPEIDRYIAMPGQALGYMVGRVEIDRARAIAQRALGGRFDIRRFHEAVLGAGTITLPTMSERVNDWILAEADQRSS